jgi:putative oxidoreductase
VLDRILRTCDGRSVILIRLLVGLVVFFPEGLQKLLFPAVLGAGRFASIGIPWPEVMGPFVGVVETLCGALIIVGLMTRAAAIPLIIIMIVAILSTKVPILLEVSLCPGIPSGSSRSTAIRCRRRRTYPCCGSGRRSASLRSSR